MLSVHNSGYQVHMCGCVKTFLIVYACSGSDYMLYSVIFFSSLANCQTISELLNFYKRVAPGAATSKTKKDITAQKSIDEIQPKKQVHTCNAKLSYYEHDEEYSKFQAFELILGHAGSTAFRHLQKCLNVPKCQSTEILD